MSWRVERFREPPRGSHAREVPSPATRAVWVFEPTEPALVLGSTQARAVVRSDVEVDVVARRSGGGAVMVVPGEVLWVDVVVPADDALWDDDVGRSFAWLGATFQAALAEVGVTTSLHRGALVRTRWSDRVCFAGLGPGELRNAAGQKVVGLSQRRTRAAARFQCALLGTWDPGPLVAMLDLTPAERADAALELRGVAAGIGPDLLDASLEALLRHLP